mmetsp:Transcript_14172/g.30931  ORF Transcript_14172/g.30931 Transcript_14172/m.30931 type:complete len:393 (-) Transcript_14172:54-1232(-)|eukprot:CAMPEP_0168779664 /NCGR_PEP_ID=MMETSP0725-20121227/7722_1 /TAXON_ID=265536 /ORGANISM="Amphiprora sp., Strain CCMP467" /LENGTH=392 /DNA_ID=CAMNT_0008829487 /DNA_START=75 /DNA_END=1250 /DNA_ORIENTATION=-
MSHNNHHHNHQGEQQRPQFQEIDGHQWFLYRQGMHREDIPDGITHVLVEEGTTVVEDRAFSNCSFIYADGKYDSLQRVRIAKSVEQIGVASFCFSSSPRPNLVSVEIPDDSQLAAIGADAFGDCGSLTGDKLTFPASLRNIGNYAFSHCSLLTKLSIRGDPNHPSQLDSIGRSCWKRCSALKEVALSHCPNLRRIKKWTFQGCTSLKTVLLPPNLEHIEDYAFQECKALEVIIFPKTLQLIGQNAFEGCTQLQSLKFPGALGTIERYAFGGCTVLGQVEFESVASIRGAISIFHGCVYLHSITWLQDTMPCAVWPRWIAQLFLGNSQRFSIPKKNQSSCLFSSFRASHEKLLSNQRAAPRLRRSSRRRQTVVGFGGGGGGAQTKKGRRNGRG